MEPGRVVEDDFKLLILLPSPPKCCDHGDVAPHSLFHAREGTQDLNARPALYQLNGTPGLPPSFG